MARTLRLFLSILAVALLVPAMAANAVLISANVSISSTHDPIAMGNGYIDFSYSATGQGPGATASGGGCGLTGAIDPCSFSFSLSATGFSFTESCQNPDNCLLPTVTVTLSNMQFSGGEILVGVGLTETPNGPPPPSQQGSTSFTSHSVTLSITAYDVTCGALGITDAVTFETATPPRSDVPEPSSAMLVGMGIVGLAWLYRGRRRHSRMMMDGPSP